ncbi:3-hydroxyacyl-CoA dehydrogenase family protein [Tomitella biformata]|uniref:3-hydroxyacyl-CoA dehydrogenase family protein n=1 Tax=Tomitella biformata TaxID=630403 RepID=UPI000464B357|nr:3-hydroxyacyl-CoA dehydrogenase family protein [Tomitella biformata]
MSTAPVTSVGVVGAGTMGIGIAYVFAAAGCDVTLVEPDADRRAAARGAIVGRAERMEEQGRLESDRASHVSDTVDTAESVSDLATGLDLVVEAVPEILELKHSVLRAIEEREPKLLGTNTSALGIASLATVLARPETFIGMHFFNPVWTMPLLELIRGANTSDATVALTQRIGEFIGKDTILVNDIPGFATSRLGVALGLEAIRMVEDGVASPEDIDRAMVLGYRHPMGPLRLTDLVGLDVRLHIARGLSESLGPRFTPPQLMIDMVERGDIGKKSGQGFFDWSGK